MMKLRHRYYLVACAAVAIGWIVYALAKHRVAVAVAGRFGEALLRLGQGKFSDATLFVQHRLCEALWLATLALLFMAAQRLFNRLAHARIQRARWAAQGVVGFVLLNLWIGAAMNAALFWGAMGVGAGLQNLMQFHFKRILAEENPIATRAVMVGSSQTRAQIDEDQLNTILGPRLWTTELHWPGSQGFDLLLVERQIHHANPQLIICYLSEGNFYTGAAGEAIPPFLRLSDIPDCLRRGAFHQLPAGKFFLAMLGDLMPLFRCRDVVAQRVLGSAIVQLKQKQYDASLQPDLDARARESASKFHLGAESEFQKRAFEDFVARCQRANRRVILIAGGHNPVLARRIDPAIRADMLNFLHKLQKHYPAVTVVPQTDLADQTSADYDDLSHVNKDMQRRFTTALAKRLDGFLAGENRKN